MAKKIKALAGMKGTCYALDKNRKIVRELPERMEKRMQNIAARNEILHAAEAYSARLERACGLECCFRMLGRFERSSGC